MNCQLYFFCTLTGKYGRTQWTVKAVDFTWELLKRGGSRSTGGPGSTPTSSSSHTPPVLGSAGHPKKPNGSRQTRRRLLQPHSIPILLQSEAFHAAQMDDALPLVAHIWLNLSLLTYSRQNSNSHNMLLRDPCRWLQISSDF